MNRFRRFMYGRYGFDQFSQALVVVSLIISLLGSLLRNDVVVYLSYLPFAYAIYRILSKDINKRTKENYKFTSKWNQIKYNLQKGKKMAQGTSTHKYYKCPKCKQAIRVPRGKGKICIACPKCKNEFIKRT